MKKKLKQYSRQLRRNMTNEEKHLWYDFLKKIPVTVHRQKVIGNYILDFYIASAKLAIELDGAQHYEEKAKEYDRRRDNCLSEQGIKVLRYSNIEFNEKFEGICWEIARTINERCGSDIVKYRRYSE